MNGTDPARCRPERRPYLRHLHARLARAMVLLAVGVLGAAALAGQIWHLPPWALLLGAIPVAGFVGTWLARVITDRLTRLRDAVERLTLDGEGERVLVEGADEVADLARAVNRMADRLAAQEHVRRDFFADVAHELRHPLALLVGRIEALQDGALPMDLTAVGQLSDSASALARLIDDVRDLSLAEVGQLHLALEAVDVGALVAELQELLEPLARMNDLTLRAAVSESPLVAEADPGRVRQALLNLLTNAIRHTPPGGTVELRARATGPGSVALEVADTGPGISPDRLPHIFHRFYAGGEGGGEGGTGLGLAVAKSLVDAHGGHIAVVSEAGRGTRFTVVLPATPGSGPSIGASGTGTGSSSVSAR